MLADVSALVADLREMSDGGVRVVATYDREDYELHYVRDDVAERAASRAPPVHEDLIFEGIGREHLEDLFQAGDLECSIHRFEELTACHFVAGQYSGLFVSVDAGVDVPLATFADRCRAALAD